MQYPRDKEIYNLRKQGLTQQQIGDRYGMTRQRVQQICEAERWKEERKSNDNHRP